MIFCLFFTIVHKIINNLKIIMLVILFMGKHFISIILLLPPFPMINISTVMYHVPSRWSFGNKTCFFCIVLYDTAVLYTSLVRPTLEYANAAWTPILRRDQILLENVQRRATKLIPELRDRDYEDRLRTLKLPSLYYRRARGDMIDAYKFTHSIYKTEQEPLQRETNTTTRGHSYKLKK